MTIQQSIPAPSDAAPATDAAARVTPMMEQYLEIKAANPGLLLFYRMGDFYELFFEDAEIASRALGIMLTKRGKHQGTDIPMCGVPVERSDDYLHRLIASGHRVAVCEQMEDPAAARARGNKSVVRRDVVRLVTPGTLTEDTLLDARANNYLLALARARGSAGGDRLGLAWIDISTSEFIVTECATGELAATLARINPNEVIVTDALYGDPDLGPLLRELPAVTPLTRDVFDSATSERRLCDYFAVATMDGLSAMSRLGATPPAAPPAVTYIDRTQVGKRPPLSPPSREAAGTTMAIDPATRANLELTRTLAGERRGSLLDAIDCTVTPAGSRLLAQRLAAPLTDSAGIARRLDAIATFVADSFTRDDIRTTLRAAPDMSRALARLSVGRGGPRDLAGLRDGILAADQALARLAGLGDPPPEIAAVMEALRRPSRELAREFERALAEQLPLIKRDGGFVREGYEAALDETRNLRDASRLVVASMQARYADLTGVKGLKIRHNNVLGYFVEVTAQHGDKLMTPPLNATFIHRQTLAGQTRFTTAELGEIEAKIANAGDRALGLELEIFERLCALAVAASDDLRAAAHAFAMLDVATALAKLAVDDNYVRPEVDGSLGFAIEGGRHPVVEQALKRAGQPFIANACDLSPGPGQTSGQIWLITGPNMAGKSTFLRQNALIALLAQIGSFVPASRARIGVVDRLFSRVGAADDLARGRSTFMVEMVETAVILNQASERSLVILDEIGRGTATFDGLSIAWAAIEHLHESNRCRALFATHYHELTALSAKLPRMFNATVRVKEWQGDVVFLHEVLPGSADRSYGIQVAKLAGLPPPVIARAKSVLAKLEAQDRGQTARALVDDLPLFAVPSRAAAEPQPPSAAEQLIEALQALHPDEMSPRDALQALYALKAKLPKQ